MPFDPTKYEEMEFALARRNIETGKLELTEAGKKLKRRVDLEEENQKIADRAREIIESWPEWKQEYAKSYSTLKRRNQWNL